jgi:glutamate/tyrosine decarboxylase-like PLP-dependent enzyme
MTLEKNSLSALDAALAELERGFAGMPAHAAELAPAEFARLSAVLLELARRLHDNFPYPHPLYAGQMLTPPHPVARTAYALAQWINPNNHALDGGRATSALEKEALGELAAMFSWSEHLGHVTSGGTMANLEALWIAGRLAPGQALLASAQAHYTHARLSEVLGLAFESVPADALGRMDARALEQRLAQGGVGTVVATLGTTSTGSVDPLPRILELARAHGARVHVDAAYGGYFGLAGNLAPHARAAFDAIGAADSIAIDPHKHGLQPYGCGAILFREPAVGRFYKHDSPYTYFSSNELHLGEITLECSRPGAASAALWATQRMFPLTPGGEFARGLESCHRAALALHEHLRGDRRWRTAFEPELDIVVWAAREKSASATSARSRALFEAAAKRNLHLALATLPRALLEPHWPGLEWDAPGATVLRSCLLKPEHEAWVGRIASILDELVG